MPMAGAGDLSIDSLLQELEDAEAKDKQSPLVPASAGLPFRIVSVGLEGESVLVPASVGDAGPGLGANATPRRRDAISASTLPFGASSLPTLAPPCRQELQDRYLSMSAHVAAETQLQGADKWFDKTTWPRSIGSSLLTVAMSQARSTTMAVKPAKDLKTFLGHSLGHHGPFPPSCRDLDSGWEVEEVPVDGDGAGGYSVGTLDKPTTRLSQYARGKTGSMNPFTPGGEDLPYANGEGGTRERVKSTSAFSGKPEPQKDYMSDLAVAESVAALNRDSQVPLLSVPPNVTFAAGLTKEHVAEGAPLWAGQARRRRIIDDTKASAAAAAASGSGAEGGGSGGSAEQEPEDLPPPPRIGGAPKAAHKSSGQQRMQAPKARPGEGGSTIDFSSLFAELDSDLSSDGESDESEDDDGEAAATAVDEGEHQGGRAGGEAGALDQERLASEVEGLSLSASGGSATASEAQAGGDAEGGQEAPLDSLLASTTEVGGVGKSNAHQQSMTEHLLKTPDERKQPTRSTSASTSTSSSTKGSFALSSDKPTRGRGGGTAAKGSSGGAKWAVTELLDVSDFEALVPRPAHRFPFTLDGFQKQAVARLERAECVFVSAHTSAGKTVVAEYAIAMAQQHMTRAIYTSPIKALSNQKYRDFKTRFGDVGLITGDVSINPEASCLIMTTEILRSMLYRGADLIRDIEWVVFDEVHYVNDSERGVVWEEVIIMLPDHANMIFLSATTPNTVEFCDWIGRTKRKPVHVITTTYRPVPLGHHLFAGNELYPIMDNLGKFESNGYNEAAAALMSKEDKKAAGGRGGRGGRGGGGSMGGGRRGRGGRGGRDTQGSRNQWQSLIKTLEKDGLLPVVVFSFSKKKCQECAEGLSSVTLTTAKEKSEIHLFCASAVRRLQDQDAQLPQVLKLKEMLSRGIGVHHGGLLPILKEIVEICFSRGLVKVLFATETFAMGVNMPARTVVFNGTRKHDGKDFRDLLPGEYTQMAGRAGRRGLDKVGTVIITCWSEPPPLVNLKMMLTGAATKLESQFRLKWNMILNLLRVEDMSVEDMMKRSFSEFRTQREMGAKDWPKVMKKCTDALNHLRATAEPCIRSEQSTIQEYHFLSTMASETSRDLLDYAMRSSKNARSVLGARRGLVITHKKLVNTPAVILRGHDDPGGRGAMTATHLGGGGAQDFLREARAQAQGSLPGAVATSEAALKMLVLVLCHEGFVRPVDVAAADKDAAAERTPIDSFARLRGDMVVKRKGDDDDDGGWGGGGWGGGMGGKGKASSRRGGTSSASQAVVRRGKVLKAGSYGEIAGRTFAVLEVGLGDIVSLAKPWKKLNAEDLLGGDTAALASAVQTLIEVESTLPSEKHPKGTFTPVNLASELKVQEIGFRESSADLLDVLDNRAASQCHTCPKLSEQYHLEQKRDKLERMVQFLRHALSSEALSLFPDFQQRLGVLRSLGYVEENTVQLKGRVACEINTCDELIATEMVFENVLESLDPPEIAGILSALIFQEKTQNEPPLTDRLQTAVAQVVTIARSLGRLQHDHGLPIDPEENIKLNLNFGLVDVVYEWARGVPFCEITQITLVQEGSVVRAITRLDELCREVRNAARVIGDPTLYRKMEATSQLIKRDIVFAASLYVT